MAQEFLTLSETAKALKISERALQELLAKKAIAASKIRGKWRFRRKDVEAWLQRTRHSAGRGTPHRSVNAVAKATRTKPLPQAIPVRPPPIVLSALTERVSQERMHELFVEALGERVQWHTPLGVKPLELNLKPPAPHRVRVYMFNATRPPGGRPLGEHKIQIIVPGQKRGEPGNFDNSDGRLVLLSGYSAEEQVFVLWDAGLYANFAWSRNVQVKPATIIQASAGKLAQQERTLRPAGRGAVVETLIAANAQRLPEAVELRIAMTLNRLLKA